MRTSIAGVILLCALAAGAHSAWLFSQIGPPSGPVTSAFGPGYERWQKQRRIEAMVGMREAFTLDYINRVEIPASMGMALVAIILTIPGWPTRRMDRSLAVVCGVWLLIAFVLSFRFGSEYQAANGSVTARDRDFDDS